MSFNINQIYLCLMQEFTEKISADSLESWTFNFRRLYTGDKFVYYVYTGNGPEGEHAFTMTPKPSGDWRIINAPKVPDWIEKLETQLSAAIKYYDMEKN